jgi:hypothetical protein
MIVSINYGEYIFIIIRTKLFTVNYKGVRKDEAI